MSAKHTHAVQVTNVDNNVCLVTGRKVSFDRNLSFEPQDYVGMLTSFIIIMLVVPSQDKLSHVRYSPDGEPAPIMLEEGGYYKLRINVFEKVPWPFYCIYYSGSQ